MRYQSTFDTDTVFDRECTWRISAMAHLNVDQATLDAIPRDELVIVPR